MAKPIPPEKFHWPGEKKTRLHTIPFKAHQQNVRQKRKTQRRDEWRKTPVAPGSALTNWQAKKTRNAAAKLQFGDQLRAQGQDVRQAQTFRSDIGSYYDQYLAQLAEHSQQAQQFGAAAQQQINGLQQGVTGLAQADLTGIQGQATRDATVRGAQAADQSQMASQAAATRQALVGSYAAQQAGVNAARSNYADSLQNVVGPGQKLQAQAQALGQERKARQALTDTRGQIGAFKQQMKTEQISKEQDRVLAAQIAGAKTSLDQAKLNEDIRSNKADEKIDRGRIRSEQRKATAAIKAAGGTRQTSGPFAGLTKDQINNLSDAEARKYIRAADKKKGGSSSSSGGGGGGGAKMPPVTAGRARTQVADILNFAKKAQRGDPFVKGHKKGGRGPLNRAQAAEKLLKYPKLIDPSLVSAALDAVYVGHLSHDTAIKLRRAGFSARDIASVLGTMTRSEYDKTTVGRNTKAAKGHGLPAVVGHQ